MTEQDFIRRIQSRLNLMKSLDPSATWFCEDYEDNLMYLQNILNAYANRKFKSTEPDTFA